MAIADKTNGCDGKKAYASRAAAKDPLYAERRRFPKLAFSAYKCRICGMWHIGHDRKYRNANVNLKARKQMRRRKKVKS